MEGVLDKTIVNHGRSEITSDMNIRTDSSLPAKSHKLTSTSPFFLKLITRDCTAMPCSPRIVEAEDEVDSDFGQTLHSELKIDVFPDFSGPRSTKLNLKATY